LLEKRAVATGVSSKTYAELENILLRIFSFLQYSSTDGAKHNSKNQ